MFDLMNKTCKKLRKRIVFQFKLRKLRLKRVLNVPNPSTGDDPRQ